MISILTLDAKINDHARKIPRPRPLRCPQGRRRRPRSRRHPGKDRQAQAQGAARRPYRRRHRADAHRPVVRRHVQAGRRRQSTSITEKALEVVHSGEIKFYPENWVNTYNQWLNNIQDWCISRQLWWGHQIPAWYGVNGEVSSPRTRKKPARLADKAGYAGQLTRDEDVLDTWYSSALWPFSTWTGPATRPPTPNPVCNNTCRRPCWSPASTSSSSGSPAWS